MATMFFAVCQFFVIFFYKQMAKMFFAISWQMAKSWLMANSLFPVVYSGEIKRNPVILLFLQKSSDLRKFISFQLHYITNFVKFLNR